MPQGKQASKQKRVAKAAVPAVGAAVVFLVEEVECSELHVGHFFLIERDSLRRRDVEFLWNVSGGGG